MFVDRSREKLINSIVYFAGAAECSKTKLLKLLYLVDFEHFRDTGRSVTGLNYFAWKLGPVPTELYDEFEEPSPDFSEAIALRGADFNGVPGVLARPKVEFNSRIFTRRELSILERVKIEHGRKTANALVDLTHERGGPWDRVYRERGSNARIPYELAVEGRADAEAVLEAAAERRAFLSAWAAPAEAA